MDNYFRYFFYCCLVFLSTSAFLIIGCTPCLCEEGKQTKSLTKSSSSQKQLEYIFFEHRSGTVGGRPTEKETFYLNNDGTVIISKESSNGNVADLKEGFSDTRSLFELIAGRLSHTLQDASENSELKDPLEVFEYFPPSTMLQYCYEGDHFPVIVEKPDRMICASFAHLIETLRAFIDTHVDLQSSRSGLYGRITSVSSPKKKRVSIDIKQDQLTSESQKMIHSLTQRPMALTYLSDNRKDILLGGDKHVSIKKPVYLDFNGTIFILKAFLLQNNSN